MRWTNKRDHINITSLRLCALFFILLSLIGLCLICFISKRYPGPFFAPDSSSLSSTQNGYSKEYLDWPPIKIFVYPKKKYHTDDCLYPPEMPNRYINETNYWFQRMLEPTVHQQFLKSPIVTSNPNEADVFFVPHYSRMCSGLPYDDGERWQNIPQYLSETGNYLKRYGHVDHLIMHSVPHYGDKPADNAVLSSKSPMIALLDFKVTKMRNDPWTFAKSILVPFITIPTVVQKNDIIKKKRNISAFVAMSTSTKGLRAASAVLRQKIEKELEKVPDSLAYTIIRNNYSTFRTAIDNLNELMKLSNLCIVPPGDAPSSKRFFDAINSLCVPFMLADYFFLPFEGSVFDYNDLVFQLSSREVENLAKVINNIKIGEIIEKRKNLQKVKERFTWNYKEAPKSGQALWTLSWSLYDKHRMLQPYMNNEMTGFSDDDNREFVS